MMHIGFVYAVSTYFNSELGRTMRTIDKVNLKIHLAIDLAILGLMYCVLECRLVVLVFCLLVFLHHCNVDSWTYR